MKNSEGFMSLVFTLINVTKKNRKILLIGERIKKFLDIILKKYSNENIAKFVSNSKDEALNADIVLATPGKMRDGVDVPNFDCLIKTSPISNIKQMDGRILRFKKGKKKPIIFDIVDIGCEPIKNTFWNRLKYYKKNNYNIIFYYSDKSGKKYIQLDRDKAMEILNKSRKDS
jgi:adenylate kinase family enzyme